VVSLPASLAVPGESYRIKDSSGTVQRQEETNLHLSSGFLLRSSAEKLGLHGMTTSSGKPGINNI
jgi:hypothetical protein